MADSIIDPFSRLKRRFVIYEVIIVLLLAAIFFLVPWPNRLPKANIKPAVVVEPEVKVPGLKTLHTPYFSLEYSDKYTYQTNQSPSASIDSWILLAKQALGLGLASKIAISLTNAPVGGVKEDSAYKLFASRPELYTISDATYRGETVVVGKRTTPTYEQTVLWPHGQYLLTISLTSGGDLETVIAEQEALLNSVAWK